jgi:hypothetical protein
VDRETSEGGRRHGGKGDRAWVEHSAGDGETLANLAGFALVWGGEGVLVG